MEKSAKGVDLGASESDTSLSENVIKEKLNKNIVQEDGNKDVSPRVLGHDSFAMCFLNFNVSGPCYSISSQTTRTNPPSL